MQSFSLKLSLVEYFDSRNKNALEKDISCQPLVKDESKFNRQKNINKDLHQNNEIIWIFQNIIKSFKNNLVTLVRESRLILINSKIIPAMLSEKLTRKVQ